MRTAPHRHWIGYRPKRLPLLIKPPNGLTRAQVSFGLGRGLGVKLMTLSCQFGPADLLGKFHRRQVSQG